MRPVGLLDLDAVARCLCAATVQQQYDLAREIVGRADVADRYRKRLGRRHAVYGDGTLSAATAPYATVRGRVVEQTYLAALRIVVDVLIERRGFCFSERRSIW
ncbi:hypothetical protein SAMN05428995_103111 [Loktanella sp. DSM 29012]|uniref:DUF7742 family protein n=1 Tax=Loktanella sp. DSM 29012 TaxID=1881056 RepID=UPI0008D63B96|nr:hypothetical protein [Loktanella sp. DSM 29012]SEQ17360.1 hypothetical protein SAMN05428995_103111 [Loktanella sp. DSM 29012]